MASSSGTFNFQSIEVELIIREAFERIGILGELTEPQKLESAKRSIDFMLLEWMNRGVHFWTIQNAFLPLIAGQREYVLPVTVSDILQVSLRTSTRVLGGTAESSQGGAAINAFDGNPTTACEQTAASGNISYDYGLDATRQINFVGIQSNVTRSYSLVVESSIDNVNWTTLYTIPTQEFTAGVNKWFDIPVSIYARAYRIRETGNATLNIQEIYFCNNITDNGISEITRYDYFGYSNKHTLGRPSAYYLNRGMTPVLGLWPAPSAQYNCLQFAYKQMIEDVGVLYTNTVQVPSRFYPALVAGLTYNLAIKYNPQAAAMFKSDYMESFELAQLEESTHLPIYVGGEYGGGYY